MNSCIVRGLTEREARETFEKVKGIGNGEIDFQEFAAALSTPNSPLALAAWARKAGFMTAEAASASFKSTTPPGGQTY